MIPFTLIVKHLLIDTFFLNQCVMVSLLYNFSPIHHNNSVCLGCDAQTMGHNYFCSLSGIHQDFIEEYLFQKWIYCRGRLIENDKRSILLNPPGNCNSLPLSLGQVYAAKLLGKNRFFLLG